MDESPSAVTRADLLRGLPGRRTSTVLYTIESRTAYLALKARHATAPAICDDMAARREQAFLSALGAGRDLDVAPTITELERFAPAWAHLVPRDAATRAEVARRLSSKYRFRRDDVPQLALALGLGDEAVRSAFAERFGAPLDTVFETTLSPKERRRWLRSRVTRRLETLPPFWSAYSLTLTQTVGAGVLALPIALAGVGPLPGLVLLAVLGLVNVLTAAAVAESFTRTGAVRFGGAYLGRVVTQHLGRLAGVWLAVALTALSVVALLAYYVGLSSTLAIATGVPTGVWAVGLFAVTLAFTWRGRLDTTVVSALAVGAVNLAVILVLSVLALAHLDAANLTYADVPLVGGRPLDAGVVGLIFGVVLLSFFGHTAVANGARVVLRRDPSGRALVRGTAAAMLTTIALYSVWCLSIGAAVPASRLAAETGTALAPLAETAGPVVLAVGGVFAVLAMGMAAVHFSMGLHYQTTDLLGAARPAGRYLGFAPLLAVFLAVEWLLLTGRESFAGTLGLVGTLTAPLLAGIFPVLLLAAARRRGEYVPGGVARWMGRPLVLGAVYLLFLAAVIAHGAVIWEAPAQRAAAFATAGLAVAVTVWSARAGALVPLANVEIRRDSESGRDRLRLTVNGRRGRASARVRLGDRWEPLDVDGAVDVPEQAAAVAVDLESADVRELAVWAHQVDPSADTVALPVRAALTADEETQMLELEGGRGRVPLAGPRATLELTLPPRRDRAVELPGAAS